MGRWWMDAGANGASSPSSSSFLPEIVPGSITDSETHPNGMSPEYVVRKTEHIAGKMEPSPYQNKGGPAIGIRFSLHTSITKFPSYHVSSPKSTTNGGLETEVSFSFLKLLPRLTVSGSLPSILQGVYHGRGGER